MKPCNAGGSIPIVIGEISTNNDLAIRLQCASMNGIVTAAASHEFRVDRSILHKADNVGSRLSIESGEIADQDDLPITLNNGIVEIIVRTASYIVCMDKAALTVDLGNLIRFKAIVLREIADQVEISIA